MSKSQSKSVRLGVEALDSRLVPTVTVIDGTIHVNGTPGNDTVIIRLNESDLTYVITENGVNTTVSGWHFTKVYFTGNFGNDYLRIDGRFTRVNADGGDGNDTLIGGTRDDTLEGGLGSDRLEGRDGNDLLRGGVAFRTDGGASDPSPNFEYGGAGNDTVHGSAGGDYLAGDAGNDQVIGYAGNDVLYGGYGFDYVFGNEGHDHIDAGMDTQWNYLDGGVGNDTIHGGIGIDYMFGQDGRDHLYGRGGNDDLNGGDDRIADVLVGGNGRDYFQEEIVTVNGVTFNLDQPVDLTGLDFLYNS